MAVGEKRDDTFLEQSRDQRFDLEFVNVLRRLFVTVGVVEDELMVLNILRDSVNFDFGLMHLDSWVENAD